MTKFRFKPDYVVQSDRKDKPPDRRAWSRYTASGVDCWIGWWEGGQPRILPARIRDVSQGGAAVLVATPPPCHATVWFCPRASASLGWIEGISVRVTSPGKIRIALGWPFDIGLQFQSECSWDTFRTTLFGSGAPTRTAVNPPELPTPGDHPL